MATAEALLTIEDYARLPDRGGPTELVRGRVVEVPPPDFLHGLICARFALLLGMSVERTGLGRVVTNDSGIIVARNPDTVRGADVAFYGFAKIPRGTSPEHYPAVPPDLVVEIRSPSDRWSDIHEKVAEYLSIGVPIVCVLDPRPRRAHLFYPDRPNQVLGPEEEMSFPEILGDFRVVVGELFAV